MMMLIFGVLLALGIEPAGWLLGVTLLLALFGLIRTVTRGALTPIFRRNSFHFIVDQGTTGTCVRPSVSGRPNIRFMHWTAWPDAPLTRLSSTTMTTTTITTADTGASWVRGLVGSLPGQAQASRTRAFQPR